LILQLDGNAVTAALRSTSSSIQQQQASKQQPPAAPDIASRLPATTYTSNPSQQATSAGTKRSNSSSKPRKPFIRRLLRALMITGASAGLLAAGAWAGSAAYRHYMAQLDDRDQLARRVAELKKQEEKLLLR
jgi:hypothetical protein